METASWLLGEISSIFGSAIWGFLSKGFLYGLLGLVGGFALLWIVRKRGGLKRPNRVWSFLANLHLIYVPVLLMILFAAFGSLFSIHNTIDNWIDNSTGAIQEYAAGYVPEIERIGRELMASSDTSEDALEEQMEENSQGAGNWLGRRFYNWFNRNIISYVLSYFGYEDSADGLVSLVQEQDLSKLNASVFSGLSGTMKTNLSGSYFGAIYLTIFWFALPFALVPLGEWLLYFLNRKAFSGQRKSRLEGSSVS